MEIWKAIPGFEGYYEVSDTGQVRSLSRIIKSTGAKAHERKIKSRVLAPSFSNGYISYVLWKEHKQTTIRAYAAVALAFIGPRPKGYYVCHRDGNRTNNQLSNIYYGTPSENTADARRHGTIPMGEKAAASRLSETQISEIRSKAAYTLQRDLAKLFGISQSHISRIINRQKWQSLGMN